ncbi:hypothetical protein Tco_0370397, partial [Tanacetum coccineum]
MPQLKSTQLKDKVMQKNSQVILKKKEVEDHCRISSFSNKTKSVTACNDSLNAKTSNVKVVCATCDKCVFNSNHDDCVYKFINDVNVGTKKPHVLPIRTRKPTRKANQSVATPHKKIVASKSTIQKSRSYFRMLYEKTQTTWTWSINVAEPLTKMRSNSPSSFNSFANRTVQLKNDQFAPILGYGDLVQGKVMIKRVYYIEGLNYNLFSVGQFCDADLE